MSAPTTKLTRVQGLEDGFAHRKPRSIRSPYYEGWLDGRFPKTRKKPVSRLLGALGFGGQRTDHATIKTDTTDDFVAYLAANGVELGRPGAAKGAIRIGNSTAFVKESTDPTTGALEITISHPSSRGTSRQRFTSRQRALADIQRADQVLRRMAGAK